MKNHNILILLFAFILAYFADWIGPMILAPNLGPIVAILFIGWEILSELDELKKK